MRTATHLPRWRPLLVVTLALLNACAQGDPAPGTQGASNSPLTDAQVASIKDSVTAMLSAYTARVNAGDSDSAGRFYLDDPRFSWAEDGSFRYRTADEVRQGLTSMGKQSEVELTFEQTEIIPVAAGVAVIRTVFRQGFATGGRTTLTLGGIITMTVINTADGWKILTGHTSSRRPRS